MKSRLTRRKRRIVLSDDEDEENMDCIQEKGEKKTIVEVSQNLTEEKVDKGVTIGDNDQRGSSNYIENYNDDDYPSRTLGNRRKKRNKVLLSESEEEELTKNDKISKEQLPDGLTRHMNITHETEEESRHEHWDKYGQESPRVRLCRGENLEQKIENVKGGGKNKGKLPQHRTKLRKGIKEEVDRLQMYEESVEEEEAILKEYEQKLREEGEDGDNWLVEDDEQINAEADVDIDNDSDENFIIQCSLNNTHEHTNDLKEEKVKQMLVHKDKVRVYINSKGIKFSSKRASKLIFYSLEIFAFDTFALLTEELEWGYSYKNKVGDNILMFLLRIFPTFIQLSSEERNQEGMGVKSLKNPEKLNTTLISDKIRYYELIEKVIHSYRKKNEFTHTNNDHQNFLHLAAQYVHDIYIVQILFNALEKFVPTKEKKSSSPEKSNSQGDVKGQFEVLMNQLDIVNVTPLFLACEYGNEYFVSLALRWKSGPSFSFSSSAYLRPLIEKDQNNVGQSFKNKKGAIGMKTNMEKRQNLLQDKIDYLLIKCDLPLERNHLLFISNKSTYPVDDLKSPSIVKSIKMAKKKFSAFCPVEYNSLAPFLVSHTKPMSGMNCLIMAIFAKSTIIVKEITNASSNLVLEAADNEGFTCLHYIAEIGLEPAILIPDISSKCPALLNRQDHLGRTPLHIASASGQTEAISILLSQGAKATVVDYEGWPPLLYSDFSGNRTCTSLLLQTDTAAQVLSLGKLLANLGESRKKSTKVENLIKSMITTPQYSSMLNTIIRGRPELLYSTFSFLLNEPKLLDTTNKKEYMIFYFQQLHLVISKFQGSMGIMNDHIIHIMEGTVQNKNVWAQLKQLCFQNKISENTQGKKSKLAIIDTDSKVPNQNMLMKLTSPNSLFQYKNGIGIGQGIDREILCVLASIVTDPDIGFLSKDNDGATYLPKLSKFHDENYEYERGSLVEDYRTLGLLLGHVLKTKKHLPIPFHPLFMTLICNESVSYHCLFDLDEELARSLHWIMDQELNADYDPIGDLELNFTWNDGTKDIPLVEDGQNIKVTILNREEYVNLITTRKIECYKKYATIIRESILTLWNFGLHDDSHREELLKLLRMFQGSEMAVVISGSFDVDISNLRENCTWEDLGKENINLSPSLCNDLKEWFWNYLEQLSQDDKALLLKFVTGSTAIPINGFKLLKPPFKVTIVPYIASESLPRAATCFNTLKLPRYPEKYLLEKNLMIAMRFGSEGFSFL